MGLFDRFKKEKVVDLGVAYRKKLDEEKQAEALREKMQSSTEVSAANGLSFLGSLAKASENSQKNSSSEGYLDLASDASARRERLAKRLLNITNQIEDLSNQIYKLSQRIDLLERKLSIS